MGWGAERKPCCPPRPREEPGALLLKGAQSTSACSPAVSCELQSGDWLGPLKRKWPQHLTEGASFSCVGVSDRGQNNALLCVQSKAHAAAQTTGSCPLFFHGSSEEPACSLGPTAPLCLPLPVPVDLAPPEVSGQVSCTLQAPPTVFTSLGWPKGFGWHICRMLLVRWSSLAEAEVGLEGELLCPLHAVTGFWLPTEFCLSSDRVPTCASMVTPTQNN